MYQNHAFALPQTTKIKPSESTGENVRYQSPTNVINVGPSPYSPGEGSQLAVRLNRDPSTGHLIGHSRTRSDPLIHQVGETEEKPMMASQSLAPPRNLPQIGITSIDAAGGRPNYQYGVEHDSRPSIHDTSRDKPTETHMDYGPDNYSARGKSPRIVILSERSGESVPMPKKSSLLDKFIKQEIEKEQEQKRPSLLGQPIPKLEIISRIDESSQDLQPSTSPASNPEKASEPRQKITQGLADDSEYFTFSDKKEEQQSNSDPQSFRTQEAITSRTFFDSQIKDDLRASGQSPFKIENQYFGKVSDFDSNIRELDPIYKDCGCTNNIEKKLNEAKAKHAEELRQVHQQSQKIVEQTNEYKKITDGYINQLEAKNKSLEEEINKKNAQIKDLQDQIRTRSTSPQYQSKAINQPIASLNHPVQKIVQVFKEFFNDMNTCLQNSKATMNSPTLVSHIQSQLDQLAAKSPENWVSETQHHELKNLKVLLASLNKVVGSVQTAQTPASLDLQRPNYGYQADGSQSSRNTSPRPSLILTNTGLSSNSHSEAVIKKLQEENLRLGEIFSVIKAENRTLRTQLQQRPT